jgi:hypothetical protein
MIIQEFKKMFLDGMWKEILNRIFVLMQELEG